MNTKDDLLNGDAPEHPSDPLNAPNWSRKKLEEIPVPRHPHGGVGFKMPGARGWVTEKTLRRAWTLFWANVRLLDRNRKHSAEDLAGAAAWAERSRGECIALGRCFKYFALH